MPSRLLIILSVALLARLAARAQTAGEFFNSGAQFYISNNIPDAWKKVEAGRKLYPDDVKLKKLEELLKQQQQQQQQQSQQNQQSQNNQRQNSKSQQQQHQNQRSNRQQAPNQQRQNQQQANQSGQKKQQPRQQQARQSAGGKNSQSKSARNEENHGHAANQMTPQEARRLLNSQKDQEEMLPAPRNQTAPPEQGPIEDW